MLFFSFLGFHINWLGSRTLNPVLSCLSGIQGCSCSPGRSPRVGGGGLIRDELRDSRPTRRSGEMHPQGPRWAHEREAESRYRSADTQAASLGPPDPPATPRSQLPRRRKSLRRGNTSSLLMDPRSERLRGRAVSSVPLKVHDMLMVFFFRICRAQLELLCSLTDSLGLGV